VGSTGSLAVPARCPGSAGSSSTAAAATQHPAQGCPASSNTAAGAALSQVSAASCLQSRRHIGRYLECNPHSIKLRVVLQAATHHAGRQQTLWHMSRMLGMLSMCLAVFHSREYAVLAAAAACAAAVAQRHLEVSLLQIYALISKQCKAVRLQTHGACAWCLCCVRIVDSPTTKSTHAACQCSRLLHCCLHC
jgi:hypothetical protein